MSPRKCTAIKSWLLLGLLSVCLSASAGQSVGTVTDLSGPLLAKKPDGTAKILSQKSEVEQGDILVTEKNTYARIKFADSSEVTLRPNTQFKIENFSYAEDKPQSDNSVFSLLKGGLRAVTGALGKRSREKVSVNTPAATIGIRGTTYIAEYVAPDEEAVAAYGRASLAVLDISAPSSPSRVISDVQQSDSRPAMHADAILPMRVAQAATGSSGRAPGLYVSVLDGMVHLTNSGGSQSFAAGQFGYSAGFRQPPVVLPSNPGMQFAPPPAFNSSSGAATTNKATGSSSSVDCEVR